MNKALKVLIVTIAVWLTALTITFLSVASALAGIVSHKAFPFPPTLQPPPIRHYYKQHHRPHKRHRLVRQYRVVRAVLSQLGRPYRWGGTSPSSGFDCSGLVGWAYRRGARISLPRTTYQQIDRGIHIRLRNIRPGDVLFVNHDEHEGLYIGHGVVVHAPHTGDVVRRVSLRTFLSEGLSGVRRYIKKSGRAAV